MTMLEIQQAAQIEELKAQITELNRIIAEQAELIAELKEQLGKNSRNSSRPPSSDGYGKPAPKSLRGKSDRKQGGQVGHKGETLKINVEPTETISHMPTRCEMCPHYKDCLGKACVAETRRVADASIEIKVTAHEVMEVACPLSGEKMKGSFPEDVNAPLQYGKTLQALVVSFSTVGAVSANRIHELFGSVFGIPLSTSTIVNMNRQCSEKLADVDVLLKTKMMEAAVGHFDETGIRVDKHLRWVHVASDSNTTYLYLSEKRGKDGMDEGGVLPNFNGIAVHDCWAPYWKYDIQHGICCAHLLRELNGVQENHPEQKWANCFEKLLLRMKSEKEEAIHAGNTSLSENALRIISEEYDRILEMAYNENPVPVNDQHKKGKPKRGKVLALIDRLKKYKESVCLFIKTFAVPFDNNQAERDLRMVKVKTKVSGCFRTEDGAKDFLRILSYTATARKHGINPFKAINNALLSKPVLP